MYACLHAPEARAGALAEIAARFSPAVEETDAATVVFSIDGLGALIGTPRQIASEIAREGERLGVRANLAIASNPGAAIHAARHTTGVAIIEPGEEAGALGAIPLGRLPIPPEMHATLARWGVRTLGEFAALPPLAVAERFGVEGLELQDTARGSVRRPLKLSREPLRLERRVELEHALDNLEPLLFLVNGILAELCGVMSHHGVAAAGLRLRLELESSPPHESSLDFPVPIRRAADMLKLIELHLNSDAPQAPVTAAALALAASEPRAAQGGLYTPASPEPARLEITLARIGGLVGRDRLGAPEMVDTHRPDAFVLRRSFGQAPGPRRPPGPPAIALRLYRPPLGARVAVERGHPREVAAPGVAGRVVDCAGPWRGSGDWWTQAAWARDEWDVALDGAGVYRIYRRLDAAAGWYVMGEYD
jgi:protein ImuB